MAETFGVCLFEMKTLMFGSSKALQHLGNERMLLMQSAFESRSSSLAAFNSSQSCINF